MSEEPEKLNLESLYITEERHNQLKQIFPEVFTEGDQIDFDKLKTTLGSHVDENGERFGLQWPGKRDCFKIIQEPAKGTLQPAPEESEGWDNTENLLIEGDNLEVAGLRLMCNEIFGEENFVGNFVWKRRSSSALAELNISVDHKYVLTYQKGGLKALAGRPKDYSSYKNPDNDPIGPWTLGDLTVGMTITQRPNQFYDLTDPDTEKGYKGNPDRVWAFIKSSMNKLLEEKRIYFSEELILRIAEKKPSKVVVLDKGFNGQDELKTNAVQIMKSHGVDDFKTV